MRLTRIRHIPSSPENLFSYVTEPERMENWMGASISRVGEHPQDDRVGSVRQVQAGFLSFAETITRYAPPNTCEYTVDTGFPFTEYRSRFDIEEQDGGSQVTWEITIRTEHVLLDRLCSALVGTFMLSALAKLARCAAVAS